MSLIPEHEELLVYDAKGRAVCPHRLRICHICCVDYTYISSDEEMDEEDEERVFILVGETARFTPQSDQQLLAPSLRMETSYDNPPKPTAPDQLATHYCGDCQLAWLEGQEGPEAAGSHPSHHTFFHQYTGTSRSLMVYIDGACPGNGSNPAKAAIGVYFGPRSGHNFSRLLNSQKPTNQSAETEAAVAAMHYIRTVIVPRRKTLVQSVSRGNSKDAIKVAVRFRLILATDSSYLVECICKHMKQWKYDETQQVYRNRRGQVIENSDGFRRIFDERDKLSMVGVQVVWYHVPRRFNANADRLANSALI
ncbi:uncharacterized protein DFL_000480 [Arthrobotrys flagrans]|uniref:RNase H type-1 domain-containing protein n=1 Tax=Arthrobotrys flagrans TaxID=97331 RepID=A0A437ADW9_ARTFL|nr:hypothetical protein DFL_000480 [Arthrobotrys flagrans]